MRKVRQVIIFVALFILLLGAAALSGVWAGNVMYDYFVKPAVFNKWVNNNYLMYLIIAAVVYGVNFPFLFYCRSGITPFDKRKRNFGKIVVGSMAANIFVTVIGAFVCSYFNPVEAGDFMFTSHCLCLSLIPVMLLIALLCLLTIRPVAGLIKY